MTDPTFSLVRNRAIKQILISDFRDLQGCLADGLWTPAVVLAGSIIEAVLFDFLVSEGTKIEDISNLTLGGLISRATAKSVINEQTEKISSAIKDYRNLIHPGRSLVDGVSADQATAEIANALLSLVLDDISKMRMASPTTTAADVLGAILSDPSKIHIAKFLVAPLSADEIRGLLLELIPEALIDEYSMSGLETNDARVDLLTRLFHVVYQHTSPDVQTAVAERYVKLLKDEPEAVVSVHTNCLFTVEFLLYLYGEEKDIVKEHMKGRLFSGRMEAKDLPRYESISYHFDEIEIFDILQVFFKCVGYTKSDTDARKFAKWIAEEYETYCSESQKPKVRELARGWEEQFVESNNLKAMARILDLRRRLGDETSTYRFDVEPF